MKMPRCLPPASVLVLAGALTATPLALAGKAQDAGAVEGDTLIDELTPEQKKQQAREERIAEYLRKKEEQRLAREEAAAAEALEIEKRQLEEQAAADAAAAETAAPETAVPEAAAVTGAAAAPRKSSLPKDLAKAQERVRASGLSEDPTVSAIMEQIDRQMASPQQLAAFGNFVSDFGLNREALEYYRVALRVEPNDPVMWANLGTLHRKLKELSPAESAYARALSLNPNYALAHYNIGAIHDERDNYKQALESYMMALRLDPTLADPEFNPQAVGNSLLPTVQLMLYEETVGAAGLPLVPFGNGDTSAVAAPAEPPTP